MKTASSLTVIAIGAILAFAVTASPTFLDLNKVGWILMLTGACGIALTPRGQNWLRRTIIIRGAPSGSTRTGRSFRQRTRSPARRTQAPPTQAPPTQPSTHQAPPEHADPSASEQAGGTEPAAGAGAGVPHSRRPSDEPSTQPFERLADPATGAPQPPAPQPPASSAGHSASPGPQVTIEEYIEQ